MTKRVCAKCYGDKVRQTTIEEVKCKLPLLGNTMVSQSFLDGWLTYDSAIKSNLKEMRDK